MSRAEDLPQDLHNSLEFVDAHRTVPATSATPTSKSITIPFPIKEGTLTTQDATTPSLPPHMASVRSHTADEIVQMMNRTPLFMTSLENTGEDGENVELEAMRALQYEGTPAEIAQGFKEQGNEMAKVKRWKDGKEFYTKGIAVLVQEKQRRGGLTDKKAEVGEDREVRQRVDIEEACYVNRALCNLELKNYRSTTLDCAAALRLNSRNVKAYYRSSSALFALDKLDEALDACTRGLTIDSKNSALKNLNAKIKARSDTLSTARRKREQQSERAQREKSLLATALRARNIQVRNTVPPDMEDAAIRLAPDPMSPTSMLQFPVVLLYPLHAQSDFIKAFSETDTVPQHLDYIFPLPWDVEQEYTVGGVEFYMETGNGGLVKVGRNVTLGKVLGSDGVEIVDGIVRVNVLIKGRTSGWIEEMEARKSKKT